MNDFEDGRRLSAIIASASHDVRRKGKNRDIGVVVKAIRYARKGADVS